MLPEDPLADESHVCDRCHTTIRECSADINDPDPPRCLACNSKVQCPIHGVVAVHWDGPEALCCVCVAEITPRHLYRAPRGALQTAGVLLWLAVAIGVAATGLILIGSSILHK